MVNNIAVTYWNTDDDGDFDDHGWTFVGGGNTGGNSDAFGMGVEACLSLVMGNYVTACIVTEDGEQYLYGHK